MGMAGGCESVHHFPRGCTQFSASLPAWAAGANTGASSHLAAAAVAYLRSPVVFEEVGPCQPQNATPLDPERGSKVRHLKPSPPTRLPPGWSLSRLLSGDETGRVAAICKIPQSP